MHKLAILLIGIGFITWGCVPDVKEAAVELSKGSSDKIYCDFCQQEIRSQRYGGQISGYNEVLRFRSVECLAGFMLNQEIESPETVRVIDFIDAKTLIALDEAIYLQSPNLGSPNGMNFAAIDRGNADMLEKIERAYPGEYIEWEEVINRVRQSGYAFKH